MKVRIRGTQEVYHDIYVTTQDIIRAMRVQVYINIKPSDVPGSAYINEEGHFETWEDTHGSGFTEVFRKATAKEVEQYTTAQKFFALVSTFK